MTDTLRDKLINKGWVTPFNAGTLVRLIEEHYAERNKPVPVSERLPGPEDCEDEGWAWFFNKRIGWRQAVLPVSPGFTHWLPAHALPLPTSGEEES